MAVYKDGDKWRVIYRYTNYKGERKQTQKRGFATKREAVAWEREVMLKSESKLDMTFASFFEIYEEDKKKRVKENTWESKSHVIRTKILPYFGERKIAEIEPKDVIAWQNELLAYKGENGEVYSPTYLKTIHAQLSAIFNHAIRYYHLPSNPAQKAGSMGSEEHKEMLFWTKEEYLKFAYVMMDKPLSYYAFEMLYWCGIRMGDADGKISLNQQKPSKHAGLRRFGPEKFLQRNNEFMKERPIFYKKPIKTEKDFSTWLRCFYYTTKAVITEYTYF